MLEARTRYLAAVDVLDGRFAKQKVHVVLRLEAADELRIVQPPESDVALYKCKVTEIFDFVKSEGRGRGILWNSRLTWSRIGECEDSARREFCIWLDPRRKNRSAPQWTGRLLVPWLITRLRSRAASKGTSLHPTSRLSRCWCSRSAKNRVEFLTCYVQVGMDTQDDVVNTRKSKGIEFFSLVFEETEVWKFESREYLTRE